MERQALLVLTIVVLCNMSASVRYQPNWDSLDKRPLPQWYDEAKFGIFLHWGVYSVPGFNGAWFWYFWKEAPEADVIEFMRKNYRPDFTYADFAPQFTAEFYDPYEWASIFNASGARYVVLTTKHHEGFCLWPSKYSWNWNSMAVGPKRDLVGELCTAIRKTTNLKFGTYHSLFEFFNPLYLEDKANKFTTNTFVVDKAMPELYELVNSYKPDIVWSDGDWEASYNYWNSTNFLAWLYNDSPVKDTVVTNDRWGSECLCKHGGYLTCDDHYNPHVLRQRKWEDSTTVDKTAWEYRRNVELTDLHTIEELIATLVQVVSEGDLVIAIRGEQTNKGREVGMTLKMTNHFLLQHPATKFSCGGNLLLDVGPTKEGTIAPIFEERLRQMGQWLGVNGEAIYATQPWLFQNDTLHADVWYTSKKTESGVSVYAITLKWPEDPLFYLGSPVTTSETRVTLMGYPQPLDWNKVELGGVEIKMPVLTVTQIPCQWAWVFKLDNLLNV